jgi:hypothetical protein
MPLTTVECMSIFFAKFDYGIRFVILQAEQAQTGQKIGVALLEILCPAEI